ncbi:MAG: HlyD family efflux transporter periplasmic adaptor subunit [Peptococcaceae bacterium]|jgi:HlyD family secretion protein|nr:HlyD family efflux transporter periplasmic adaptor subunit [Peptococcaceae bacterium]
MKWLGKHKKMIIFLALIIAAGAAAWKFMPRGVAASAQTQEITAAVTRGSIYSSVEGSGPVASAREYVIKAPGDATVELVNVRDGELVGASQLLFQVDCPEIKNKDLRLDQYSNELGQLKERQAELNYRLGFDGRVVSVNVLKGQKVSNGTVILSVVDINKGSLQVTDEGQTWQAGDTLQLDMVDYTGSVSARIVETPRRSNLNGQDFWLYTVSLGGVQSLEGEILARVTGPGAGEDAALAGLFTAEAPQDVKATAEGTLTDIYVSEGDVVASGTLLYSIDSQALSAQILEKEASIQEALTDINQNESLVAPFEGYYYASMDLNGQVAPLVQTGDQVTKNQVFGKVVDSSRIQIAFQLDELDIDKVRIGQEVQVTADAVTGRTYVGVVTQVASEGQSSGGVTYYWVIVEVADWEGLKLGMNCDMEIITAMKEDTLLLPVSAVQSFRNVRYVLLSEGAAGAGQNPASAGTGRQAPPAANGAGGDAAGTGTGAEGGSGAGRGRAGAGGGEPGAAGPDGSGAPRTAAGEPGAGETQAGAGTDATGPGAGQGSAGAGGSSAPGAGAGQGSVSAGQDSAGADGSGAPGSGEPQAGASQAGTDTDAVGAGSSSGRDGAGADVLSRLPANAVIVEVGVSNENFVEILSGLEEGAVVIIPANNATAGMNGNQMMFGGMGPGGGGGGVMIRGAVDSAGPAPQPR